MPEVLPLILEIIGIGSAATSIGTSIYSAANKPGAPKAPTPSAAEQAATANKTKQNQEASLSQQFPGIQAATGGSLSPEAWLRLSELLTNQAGTPGIDAASQDLIKKLSGGGSTVGVGGSGLTPAGSTYG